MTIILNEAAEADPVAEAAAALVEAAALSEKAYTEADILALVSENVALQEGFFGFVKRVYTGRDSKAASAVAAAGEAIKSEEERAKLLKECDKLIAWASQQPATSTTIKRYLAGGLAAYICHALQKPATQEGYISALKETRQKIVSAKIKPAG